MSWAIVAGVGGGLLGGVGSAAGGILSQPEPAKTFAPQSFDLSSDPISTLNALDVLASQGVFLPELADQAGPVQQAIDKFRAITPVGTRRRDQSRIQVAIDDFLNGRQTPGAMLIATAGGFESVTAAHAAQKQFETSVKPRLADLAEISKLSGQRTVDVERLLSSMTKDSLPDIGTLREIEKRRLGRELTDRETAALRRASAAGFNPSGSLEEIERERTDIDIAAISRAAALLGGAEGARGLQIANLSALNPANRAQGLSPSVLTTRTPNLLGGSPGIPSTGPNPLGAGIAQGANQLGGTVTSLGLLQLRQDLALERIKAGQRGPTVEP